MAEKGAGSKGNGKVGGSLRARVADFVAIPSPHKTEVGKHVVFHKPGSQNPSKGAVARGRRRVEEFHPNNA